MIGRRHLGKALGEVVLPAPVQGHPVAVEQAELGQRIDAGGHAAKQRAVAGQLTQYLRQRRRRLARWLLGQQKQPRAAG
ncbi:hypothetical protein D3C86_1336470 [compost metagenome]